MPIIEVIKHVWAADDWALAFPVIATIGVTAAILHDYFQERSARKALASKKDGAR